MKLSKSIQCDLGESLSQGADSAWPLFSLCWFPSSCHQQQAGGPAAFLDHEVTLAWEVIQQDWRLLAPWGLWPCHASNVMLTTEPLSCDRAINLSYSTNHHFRDLLLVAKPNSEWCSHFFILKMWTLPLSLLAEPQIFPYDEKVCCQNTLSLF